MPRWLLFLALCPALAMAAVPSVQITGYVLTPDGTAPSKGTITCRLSQPGSISNGTASVRVVEETTFTLVPGTGALPATAKLVPNKGSTPGTDSISPAGTAYRCTTSLVLPNGRSAQPAVESWQIDAASGASIAIGDITRVAASGSAVTYVAGPKGADGTSGVAAGSDPVVYNASTKTVSLAPGSPVAQAPSKIVPLTQLPNASVWCPFPSGACWSAPTCAKAETVTVVTASGGRAILSGVESTCAANNLRVTDQFGLPGVLVEPQRTNYITTADNPGTQSISVPTGALKTIAWIEGSGSVALAQTGGTPTVSAMPCTITASFPCVFDVSGGSGSATISFTVTGSVTFGQVEWGGQNPGFKTSRIHTGGATRNADVVSLVNPVSTTPGCVCGSFTPENSHSWSTVSGNLWSTAVSTGANSSRVFNGGNGYLYFDTYDASAVNRRISYSGVTYWPDGSTHDVCACIDTGCSMSLWADGFLQGGSSIGVSGTGACTGFGSPIYLGGQSNGQSMLGGVISNFRVVPTANGALALPGPRIQPLQVAAMGDSITANGSPAYLTTITTALGSAYKPANFGTPGFRSSQILVDWYQRGRPSASRYVIVLAGINDINNQECGLNGANTVANLQEMYDSVRAAGMIAIPVTILPAGGQASWSGNKEVWRGQVNAWIKTYAAANGLTVVDVESVFNDGSNNLAAAYDSGDHLHPNQAGYSLLGTTIYNSVHAAGIW